MNLVTFPSDPCISFELNTYRKDHVGRVPDIRYTAKMVDSRGDDTFVVCRRVIDGRHMTQSKDVFADSIFTVGDCP